MQEAGVNLVSLGIFSWSMLEPKEGWYDLSLLDRVITLLHDGGIKVDLATATASTPPWFPVAYPHAMPVDVNGVRRSFGARQAYCPSAPEYRRAAGALAGQIAARFADHPAVVMWHVNNEYGCHNWHCYCDVSAAAFRTWLQARYGDLAELNDAWGTAFWSQRYTDWEQVDVPRAVSYNSFANPTQQLDFWRFSSDEILDCFRTEVAAIKARRDAAGDHELHELLQAARLPHLHRRAGPRVERPLPARLRRRAARNTLRCRADLMRTLAGGDPWLLMEHSTSAVNWQQRNYAKAPGQLRRNSLVTRRARRGRRAVLPVARIAGRCREVPLRPRAARGPGHQGVARGRRARREPRVDRRGRRLALRAGAGRAAARLAVVVGERTRLAPVRRRRPDGRAAALALGALPTQRRRRHPRLGRRPFPVSTGDRAGAVPASTTPRSPPSTAYVEGGGTLLVTYFSAIVDENDHIRLGGYPGGLRDLLGVRFEEFFPLAPGDSVALSSFGTGTVWSELGVATEAASRPATRPARSRARPRSPATTADPVPPGTSAPRWTTSARCSTACCPRRP